jgi:ubiquinone/menaquinone biosynthesis C-methylase UbiE
MLKEAQQRAGGALVQADMRALPLRDASFGGVWMCASLLHIPRAGVSGVLAEARRVLASNGVLYLAVQRGTGEKWSENAGGKRFFTLFQPDELVTLLTQARFTVQEHWTEQGGVEWIQMLALNAE